MVRFIDEEKCKDNPSHREMDMFVLVILTHGDVDNILYGVDSTTVKITTIRDEHLSYDVFPDMMGKPKLIFVQACQGGKD